MDTAGVDWNVHRLYSLGTFDWPFSSSLNYLEQYRLEKTRGTGRTQILARICPPRLCLSSGYVTAIDARRQGYIQRKLHWSKEQAALFGLLPFTNFIWIALTFGIPLTLVSARCFVVAEEAFPTEAFDSTFLNRFQNHDSEYYWT